MGSALGGCLIALAAPGAPLLAPTVWQDCGASGRVVQSGCYPVALFTQPQSEGFGSSGSGVPGSLISTPGTCRDSVTSCEWMEDWKSGTGSWIQPGNHFVHTNVPETGVSTKGYPYPPGLIFRNASTYSTPSTTTSVSTYRHFLTPLLSRI